MKEIYTIIKGNRILKKILKFFHENPNCIDTSENIAQWIGEKEKEVRRKLIYLVKKEILNKESTSSLEGYSYTQNKKLISEISQFMKELKNE